MLAIKAVYYKLCQGTRLVLGSNYYTLNQCWSNQLLSATGVSRGHASVLARARARETPPSHGRAFYWTRWRHGGATMRSQTKQVFQKNFTSLRIQQPTSKAPRVSREHPKRVQKEAEKYSFDF